MAPGAYHISNLSSGDLFKFSPQLKFFNQKTYVFLYSYNISYKFLGRVFSKTKYFYHLLYVPDAIFHTYKNKRIFLF